LFVCLLVCLLASPLPLLFLVGGTAGNGDRRICVMIV
jgi:hypothetical protein